MTSFHKIIILLALSAMVGLSLTAPARADGDDRDMRLCEWHDCDRDCDAQDVDAATGAPPNQDFVFSADGVWRRR